ncbi:MAG: hypothetical protein ACI8QZ_000424 [Chlamydiales bacterium]|jgi:hypothetical protein
MRTRITTKGSRSGVSLIEVLLVTSMLGVLTRALVLTTDGLGRVTSSGNTLSLLQTEAEKAARQVIGDLRRSGIFVQSTVNGKRFPSFIEEGVPIDVAFAAHAHAPVTGEAEVGDSDFGPNREVIFVLPADLDGDDRPELDLDLDGEPELDGDQDGVVTGDAADLAGLWDAADNTIADPSRVVWSHREISYVVNTAPDGLDYLERRVDGGDVSMRRVAKYVERVVFEDARDSIPGIPADAVRMRLFLRKRTPDGTLMRYESEIWVSLRNGEPTPFGAGDPEF